MGYNAELVVEILSCNYNNQPLLINCKNNKKYAIQRTFEVTSEVIQLTCSDVSKKNG